MFIMLAGLGQVCISCNLPWEPTLMPNKNNPCYTGVARGTERCKYGCITALYKVRDDKNGKYKDNHACK